MLKALVSEACLLKAGSLEPGLHEVAKAKAAAVKAVAAEAVLPQAGFFGVYRICSWPTRLPRSMRALSVMRTLANPPRSLLQVSENLRKTANLGLRLSLLLLFIAFDIFVCWEVLNGVGVDGVAVIFPFFYAFLPFFYALFPFFCAFLCFS